MPVTVVSPDSGQVPLDLVREAIVKLQASGARIVAVQEFPQPMPNQSSYLIVTDDPDAVERR